MNQRSKTAAKPKVSALKPAKTAQKSAKAPVKKAQAGGDDSFSSYKDVTGKTDFTSISFNIPELDMTKIMETMMTKPNFQFDQFANETTSIGREGVEAIIKFGTTYAKGMEEILRTAASLGQTAIEKQAELTKQMMGAKTLNEFTAAQNKIAQVSFQEFMANATKLSEMSVKVLNESIAPLNNQFTKGMTRASKLAA